MLRIRLFRTGKKNQPFFRIVVTDRRNPPKGGRFLEIVGFYNPLTKERGLKKERIEYWLSLGAQPSGPVHNLLIKEKILEGEKIPGHKKKKEKKPEAPPVVEKPEREGTKEEMKEEERVKETEKREGSGEEGVKQEIVKEEKEKPKEPEKKEEKPKELKNQEAKKKSEM